MVKGLKVDGIGRMRDFYKVEMLWDMKVSRRESFLEEVEDVGEFLDCGVGVLEGIVE